MSKKLPDFVYFWPPNAGYDKKSDVSCITIFYKGRLDAETALPLIIKSRIDIQTANLEKEKYEQSGKKSYVQ